MSSSLALKLTVEPVYNAGDKDFDALRKELPAEKVFIINPHPDDFAVCFAYQLILENRDLA